MDFQTIILNLSRYWADRGCIIAQPTDCEVGAGTFNPHTFLRSLGPEPWRVAYVQPSRRPKDGRYGENPFRLQHYYQFQVLVKPPPDDPQGWYVDSLRALGIDVVAHDLRFVEDDWEQPTLGAAGLGWEVWLDGMEVSQFTYFQQVGSIELDPICVEYTYGLERVAMFLQKKDSVFDLVWSAPFTYGDVHHQGEVQGTRYNFDEADVEMHLALFKAFEAEARRLVAKGLYLPAYEHVMKSSHSFNILDARGAIGVNERAALVGRIRGLARKVAEAYVEHRREMGFPLLGR